MRVSSSPSGPAPYMPNKNLKSRFSKMSVPICSNFWSGVITLYFRTLPYPVWVLSLPTFNEPTTRLVLTPQSLPQHQTGSSWVGLARRAKVFHSTRNFLYCPSLGNGVHKAMRPNTNILTPFRYNNHNHLIWLFCFPWKFLSLYSTVSTKK